MKLELSLAMTQKSKHNYIELQSNTFMQLSMAFTMKFPPIPRSINIVKGGCWYKKMGIFLGDEATK